jgi:hypothetical protein
LALRGGASAPQQVGDGAIVRGGGMDGVGHMDGVGVGVHLDNSCPAVFTHLDDLQEVRAGPVVQAVRAPVDAVPEAKSGFGESMRSEGKEGGLGYPGAQRVVTIPHEVPSLRLAVQAQEQAQGMCVDDEVGDRPSSGGGDSAVGSLDRPLANTKSLQNVWSVYKIVGAVDQGQTRQVWGEDGPRAKARLCIRIWCHIVSLPGIPVAFRGGICGWVGVQVGGWVGG